MADIVVPLPPNFSKLLENLFHTEKSLIKLRGALPVEKQDEYTRQIQILSKERLSYTATIKTQVPFDFEGNTVMLAEVQEKFNECLHGMISEIVEESEGLDYKESESAYTLLRRRKSTTKGMITGNFNETIETMDRILAIGENLIVQGYQKLFIDSTSMKDKLQSVIDERQNLPSCSKPLDSLILKQQFCEKQLSCLLGLLEEANTLTDLITRLQDFDKRQIQMQQASQVTIDAMKKFFYKPEVRKTNERRRTYLSVSYADPSNPREGLDILRDQINSVLRNLNNLCDMEDSKVRTVKRSDLGDDCERAHEEALRLFEEEKELLKKTLAILVSIEDNQVDLELCDTFLEEFKLPEEAPQGQLDFIKFFVQLGMNQPHQRLQQAKLFYNLVQRFDQDHSMYSSLVDKLQAEVADLGQENAKLKTEAQGRVIERISEGSHSLKELIELQEHLKSSIQDSLEGQLKKQITEIAMMSSGIGDILLNINPDEDFKIRISEFENEYSSARNITELVDLANKYQTWIFRLVCKLGRVSESHMHSNIAGIKKSRTLKEAKESIAGKPSEFPLAAMDRTLSEIIKAYLSGLEDRKGNIDSVINKQGVLARLLREYSR